jgi:hypothetical protein
MTMGAGAWAAKGKGSRSNCPSGVTTQGTLAQGQVFFYFSLDLSGLNQAVNTSTHRLGQITPGKPKNPGHAHKHQGDAQQG